VDKAKKGTTPVQGNSKLKELQGAAAVKTPAAGPMNALPAYLQKTWVAASALAIIVIIIFAISGFLFTDKMLVCSDQLNGLDSRIYYREAVLTHHQFPFWLTPRLAGMPTIDALFGDAFYPITMVMNLVFPVHKAIGLKMILHIFLAGFFFFLMMRRGFKVSAPIAFVTGVFYMLNPEFFSHIYPGHDGKMYVIAWLPFIVWRLKALGDKQSFFNATLLGLGIGASLLTSHIQMTYFVLWGLFLYLVLFVILRLIKGEYSTAFKFGGFFTLAIIVGLAIGFIQLYPALMYVRDAFSVRGVDRGFVYASSWSLHWPEFISLWVPEFVNTLSNYWNVDHTLHSGNPFKLNSEYAGGIVLVLAFVAVFWKMRPWRWFWLGIALFAVLFSLGAHTPIFKIAYDIIPGVKKFRACSMIMFWFSFSTILLAALFLKDMVSGGFDSFNDRQRKNRTTGLLIAIAGMLVVVALFSVKDFVGNIFSVKSLDPEHRQLFDMNFTSNFVPMLWLWFVFAAAVIGLIIAVIHKALKPGVALAIIFAIGFIDVMRVDAKFIETAEPAPYFYREPALDKLRSEMATAPFRVFTLPETFQQGQNAEGIQGLEGVGGFHDNELRWYREFRGEQGRNYFTKLVVPASGGGQELNPDGNVFLNIADVRYVIARNGYDLLTFENKNGLGRVSFAPNYVVMDSSQILNALQNESYDYRTTVALFAEPQQKPAASTPDSLARAAASSGFSAQWQGYTPNIRTVKVSAPQDGFLRISEVYYPGWKITVDGKESKAYRSDLAWMAIYLPKGDHVVEMKIQSLYLAKAMWVSIFTVILLVAYWGIALALRSRKPVVVTPAPAAQQL
jgi:hypothetical protein